MGTHGISIQSARYWAKVTTPLCAVAAPLAVALNSDLILVIAVITFVGAAASTIVGRGERYLDIAVAIFSACLLISIPELPRALRALPAIALSMICIAAYIDAARSLRAAAGKAPVAAA